ncbi:MAG: hypothetical protein FWG18_03050, partial [Alphaproteobacteria bacterium]|nr:hypothetical protein [Alphaproteobacteria bacterium]
VAPMYYYDAEYADEGYYPEEIIEETLAAPQPAPMPQVPNQRATTITRNVNRPGAAPSNAPRNTAPSRAVAARAAVAPVTAGAAPATRSRAASAQQATTINAPVAAQANANAVVRRTPVQNVNAARAGSLYNPTNIAYAPGTGATGGRVSVVAPVMGFTNTAERRTSTIRSGSTNAGTAAELVTGPTMEEIANLSDFCRAQFFACMDGFCDILDDNQGRCSCSPRITTYARTEKALKEATEELQNVAIKIQYIGLTKDEVASLFRATEAEEAMRGTQDTSQLKADLTKIERMVLDIRPATSIESENGFDLLNMLANNFEFDSGFDILALFGGGTRDNIINQRGADLFKTATTRCTSAVLNNCRAQGIDVTIISNAYDLEIDRQCIVYERMLEDSNTQMRRTVRNANSVLQRARLIVEQNKNVYDMRGCVNALDNCMQNEFVCGTDYENCLDPSGRYMANGRVIVGSQPGVPGGAMLGGVYDAWGYKATGNSVINPWGIATTPNSACTTGDKLGAVRTIDGKIICNGNIVEFINEFLVARPTAKALSSKTDMVSFLNNKIGFMENDKSMGFCMSILNKCQNVTYTKGIFNNQNGVTREFLNRVLVNIKVKKDEILAEYAANCISEVTQCVTQNRVVAGSEQMSDVAITACNAYIVTCKSVNGNQNQYIDADYLAILGAAMCPNAWPATGTLSGGRVINIKCCTGSDDQPKLPTRVGDTHYTC